jgi:hypothetical protein
MLKFRVLHFFLKPGSPADLTLANGGAAGYLQPSGASGNWRMNMTSRFVRQLPDTALEAQIFQNILFENFDHRQNALPSRWQRR